MKKIIALFLLGVLFTACSKTIEIEGTIKGASAFDRIEITEASGVATLPLANIGLNEKGKFVGNFEAPKNGMYLLTYDGRQNLFYMKKGQKFEFEGETGIFPTEFKIKGDMQANNEFLKQAQIAMVERTKQLDAMKEWEKGEASFVKVIEKVRTDMDKKFDELAEKYKADKEVLQWKKTDMKTGILALISQFQSIKKYVAYDPNYKVSKELMDYEKKLQDNSDELIKEHPLYRQYLLLKIHDDFQKYIDKNKGKVEENDYQLFANFLKERKELSQTAKDYLLAFSIAQQNLSPEQSEEERKKVSTVIENEIKDADVKKNMKDILFVVGGFNKGEKAPDVSLKTVDGRKFSLESQKGKPTLLVMYASWVPMLKEMNLPVIKQMADFYSSKINIVYINFDDTEAQFKKTNSLLLKGFPGTKVYAEGGLQSEFAKKYGIYSFKLAPGLLVLDKEGKVAERQFFNAGEPDFVKVMDKLSGLKAPQLNSDDVILEDDLPVPPVEDKK